MDIKNLVRSVIERFNQSHGYSEIGEFQLVQSIKNCLELKYEREVKRSWTRLKMKERNGDEISEKDYEIEQMKIENSIMHTAHLLAASSKQDLERLK